MIGMGGIGRRGEGGIGRGGEGGIGRGGGEGGIGIGSGGWIGRGGESGIGRGGEGGIGRGGEGEGEIGIGKEVAIEYIGPVHGKWHQKECAPGSKWEWHYSKHPPLR
jgi:hypothetical protein